MTTALVNLHVGAIAQHANGRSAAYDIDIASMDRSIRSGDDFFAFANGTWFKRTEIPPARSSAGVWTDLGDRALRDTHALLDGLLRETTAADDDSRKVRDFYASFMDESAIEAKGFAPIRSSSSVSDRCTARRCASRCCVRS